MRCNEEKAGMALIAAALEAAQLRLRPILMTSIRIHCRAIAIDMGKRRVCIGQPIHWYRRIGRYAYRRDTRVYLSSLYYSSFFNTCRKK